MSKDSLIKYYPSNKETKDLIVFPKKKKKKGTIWL